MENIKRFPQDFKVQTLVKLHHYNMIDGYPWGCAEVLMEEFVGFPGGGEIQAFNLLDLVDEAENVKEVSSL